MADIQTLDISWTPPDSLVATFPSTYLNEKKIAIGMGISRWLFRRVTGGKSESGLEFLFDVLGLHMYKPYNFFNYEFREEVIDPVADKMHVFESVEKITEIKKELNIYIKEVWQNMKECGAIPFVYSGNIEAGEIAICLDCTRRWLQLPERRKTFNSKHSGISLWAGLSFKPVGSIHAVFLYEDISSYNKDKSWITIDLLDPNCGIDITPEDPRICSGCGQSVSLGCCEGGAKERLCKHCMDDINNVEDLEERSCTNIECYIAGCSNFIDKRILSNMEDAEDSIIST